MGAGYHKYHYLVFNVPGGGVGEVGSEDGQQDVGLGEWEVGSSCHVLI